MLTPQHFIPRVFELIRTGSQHFKKCPSFEKHLLGTLRGESSELHVGSKPRLFQRREGWSLKDGWDLGRVRWKPDGEKMTFSGEGTPRARTEAGMCPVCSGRVKGWGDSTICCVSTKREGADTGDWGHFVEERGCVS